MAAKNPVHALLAVEGDLKNVAMKIENETANTFAKKGEHFDGIRKVYVSESDTDIGTNNTEIKEVVTTVGEKIFYAQKAIVAGLDAQLSKEETNASGTARANLNVDGVDFGDLSATALLTLEKEMVKLRKVYELIPTLDPAKTWEPDSQKGAGHWMTESGVTYRTQKNEEWIIVAPATEQHPAQVKQITKDVQVGRYLTSYQSGKVTPLAKSQLLDRIDTFILSVKKARTLANQAEVVECKIGGIIFNFINGGIL